MTAFLNHEITWLTHTQEGKLWWLQTDSTTLELASYIGAGGRELQLKAVATRRQSNPREGIVREAAGALEKAHACPIAVFFLTRFVVRSRVTAKRQWTAWCFSLLYKLKKQFVSCTVTEGLLNLTCERKQNEPSLPKRRTLVISFVEGCQWLTANIMGRKLKGCKLRSQSSESKLWDTARAIDQAVILIFFFSLSFFSYMSWTWEFCHPLLQHIIPRVSLLQ